MLERRLLVFLEIEAEPAGGKAAVAVGLVPRDQCRWLECLGDSHPANLSRGHLGEDEVVVLQRPLEDRSRVTVPYGSAGAGASGTESALDIVLRLAQASLEPDLDAVVCKARDQPPSLPVKVLQISRCI